ncbi:hypothetical protein ACFOG5_21255 [Pedobacter fastidiosus]|uniref:Outer membrane protein beta-barrel domain-containing protein n=1 Tax=Pedobacter fastidiosus TaxID=2765361 RepID=A0ABR7KP13_9SPHI|nr:hypothetical protein [Pedobacter fastidiosus]MBC6109723.1 hypothetical protein [Pedobacter fastidiosus]
MKKIIFSLTFQLFIFSCLVQDNTKTTFFKGEAGVLFGTSTEYTGDGYSSRARNLYHISAMVGKNIDSQLSIGLGADFNFFSQILQYQKNLLITPIFIHLQYSFTEKPKTLFFYSSYGLAPKFGGNFYAGNAFNLGLGWKYKPKFLAHKTLSFSTGFNNTNVKNIYHEFIDYNYGDFKSRFEYTKLNLKSLSLNVGISF